MTPPEENVPSPSPGATARFRRIGADRCGEAVSKGHRASRFFPHRFYVLPKCGPDGLKVARRMCGDAAVEECWQILLYAEEPVCSLFPDDLYFDDEVAWHQQQYGRAGQVASATLLRRGDELVTLIHQSDLVQRISRRREHKTQIENRFKGWHDMLLNAVLQIGLEWGVRTIRSPAASLARTHTDRKRAVRPELFDRLYDRDLQRCCDARREGEWWVVDVAANADRALLGAIGKETVATDRTICLSHDIERGLGHVGIDDAFAARANQEADAALSAMLALEREAGVHASYNVVGCLLGETRDRIAAGGHAVAFHSFDHRVAKPSPSEALPAQTEREQLRACRRIDYRLKGYRAPRSVITAELSDDALCYWNFEWLASSATSFGFAEPRLEGRVAKLPVHIDDIRLYRTDIEYDEWEARVVKKIGEHQVAVIGLHDCYAPFWLPRYARFLDRVRQLGTLRTLDEVAAALLFRHAV